jgi:hypothetical protein
MRVGTKTAQLDAVYFPTKTTDHSTYQKSFTTLHIHVHKERMLNNTIIFQTIRVFQHHYGNILHKNDVDVPKKIQEHCCGLVPASDTFSKAPKINLSIGVAF